jgi:hypothetical protein
MEGTTMNTICTTGPISGKDLHNIGKLPKVVDGGRDNSLTIYFESEANKNAYLAIPVERPATEHALNLDNPTDDMIDEG